LSDYSEKYFLKSLICAVSPKRYCSKTQRND